MKQRFLALLSVLAILSGVTLLAVATTDTFTVADTVTLADPPWLQISSTGSGFSLGVSSNEAYNNDGTATAPSCVEYRSSSRTFTANHYAETTVGSTFSGGQVVFVRGSTDVGNSAQDYYGFYYENSSSGDVFKLVNGSGTSIVPGGAGFSMSGSTVIGDVLRLEVSGTALTAKRNGTTVATVASDATFASGQPGFCIWGNFSKVTTWSGDDLGGGGGGGATCAGQLLILGAGCDLELEAFVRYRVGPRIAGWRPAGPASRKGAYWHWINSGRRAA